MSQRRADLSAFSFMAESAVYSIETTTTYRLTGLAVQAAVGTVSTNQKVNPGTSYLSAEVRGGCSPEGENPDLRSGLSRVGETVAYLGDIA